MENIAFRKRLSDFSSWGEQSIINPYSLLNLEMTGKAIRPLRWVIGFIFLSHFFVVFSAMEPSYYPVTLIRFLLLAFIWVLVTCMVENLVLSSNLSPRAAQENVTYLGSYRMMIKSLSLWTVSLFLYITIFLLA